MEVGVWEGQKYQVREDQGPGKENLELPGENSCWIEGEGMENEGECVQEARVTRAGKGAGNSRKGRVLGMAGWRPWSQLHSTGRALLLQLPRQEKGLQGSNMSHDMESGERDGGN